MQLPAFNYNLIVILVLILGALVGLAAGRHRLKVLILSIFVGIVLAEQFRVILIKTAPMINEIQAIFILMGAPVLLFGFGRLHHSRKDGPTKGSAIANIIAGILTAGLAVSSVLALLPPSALEAVNGDSFIAQLLGQYHLWLLGGMPVVALLLGAMKGKSAGH